MIYLDNASTTWPKPPEVAAEMTRFINEVGANPGRAAHRMALEASDLLRAVRAKLTRLFDADRPERTILCFNCTDALNVGLKSVLCEGDHVILTHVEHNAVLRPVRAMADRGFIEATWITTDQAGYNRPGRHPSGAQAEHASSGGFARQQRHRADPGRSRKSEGSSASTVPCSWPTRRRPLVSWTSRLRRCT